MIFDKLKNYEQYVLLNSKFKKAFKFLLNSDLKVLEDGKHIICGDEIFANVQTLTTKEIQEKKWEAHKDYIDIQYVINGEEKMGYGIIDDFKKIVVPYDKQKDVMFLDGEEYNFVDVKEGSFVIFYPNDVHAPMLAYENPKEIKKVIVKIKI